MNALKNLMIFAGLVMFAGTGPLMEGAPAHLSVIGYGMGIVAFGCAYVVHTMKREA